MRTLVVALDAAAVLREACGGEEPRLAHLAVVAELAGADAIRVTATEGMRPIREEDCYDLRRVARCLELRMAPTPSLLKLALEVRPDRLILAGEPNPGSFVSPPLSAAAIRERGISSLRALAEAHIATSVCVAPELEAVKALHGAGARGIELCADGAAELPPSERTEVWGRIADAARLGAKLRVPIAVSGALDARTARSVLVVAPVVETVVVGRRVLAHAQTVGLERAVREVREALV